MWLVALLMISSQPSPAWEKHQSLMSGILNGVATGGALDQPHPVSCPADDDRIARQLVTELQLNPKAMFAPISPERCISKRPMSGRELLAGPAVDEPDDGMDRDLPGPIESYDPQGAAKWMGGTTGKTSSGFRHMYFGGWQLWHPLRTFQIPAHAIGYAPDRAALMAAKARELIHRGGIEALWGYRVLGWSMHYLQDLSQPFHAVQIPDLRMVPWYVMLQWPPSAGFAELVRETTRTIANYHWAFEHYTLYRLTQPQSVYTECLDNPEAQSDTRPPLADDPRRDELGSDPHLLALRTARASVELGHDVGAASVRFFGARLKERPVDIPNGQGEPNYAELAVQPDLVEAREELTHATCRALGDASLASRIVIEWATH